ncbi:GTP-binding protein, partial [bacterium]|nr:GTP-binding protein [bacterium]
MSDTLNIVFAGHVDHGKSTVIGRMLADTGSLPKGKLEQIKESCRKNSKPFEYAFLLDALKDEQSQGITIDSARCFFKTESREYQIIDAPGHIEFLKNMVTGAARADAAILVIDAEEGVKENSRRHGYLLHMLGIRQAIILVNKMDLVDFNQEVFDRIVDEYSDFADEIDLKVNSFIPVSGMTGDNIISGSKKMNWFSGKSMLDSLEDFDSVSTMINGPLRMPVSDVYKFTRSGDNRRIIAGTIFSGSIKVGDDIIFYPSGKKGKVKTLEGFNRSKINMYEAG